MFSESRGQTFPKYEDEPVISTQATDPKAKPDSKKQGPKRKTYKYVIKNDTKGALKGNKCFEEVTHKFGFEYLIVPKGLPGNENGFRRWSHNFGVKFTLFFRNGPFWQLRLKRKYKKCRYVYGDFIG